MNIEDIEFFNKTNSRILSEPKIAQTLLVCWRKGINLSELTKYLLEKKLIDFSDLQKIPDEIYGDNDEIHNSLLTAISDAMEIYIENKKPEDQDSFAQEILLIEKKLPDINKMERILRRMTKKAKSFSNWYEIYIRSKLLPGDKKIIIEKMREFAQNYQECINLYDVSRDAEDFKKAISYSLRIEEYIELYEKAFEEKLRHEILIKINTIDNREFAFWNNYHSKIQSGTSLSNLFLQKMLATAQTFEEWQLLYKLGDNKIKQKAIDQMAKS